MNIKKNIKITAVFIVIFLLGGITGASLMPVIFNKVEGNPYSIDVLADRVYNTHLLKNAGLTPDQVEAVNMLSSEFVLKYTAERDMFMAKRRTLYSEYKFALERLLTKEQYNTFKLKSDAIMNEREIYSRNMEKQWKKEHAEIIHARLKDEGFEKKLKYINIKLAPEDIIPKDLQSADSDDKDSFDFLNRYMIDRVKNKWGTYNIYHEMGEDIKAEDIMEP